LLAASHQGNADRNHKLWNTASTNRYILHIYADAGGMLLHITEKLKMGKTKCISFVVT